MINKTTVTTIATEATTGFELANACTDPVDSMMLADTEMLKQLLSYCSVVSGATITITIEHDNGHKAVAKLYDHAALVQGLCDALEYFQSEFS